MDTRGAELTRGLRALRLALAEVLYPAPALVCAPPGSGRPAPSWLMSEALDYNAPGSGLGPSGDSDLACSSEEDEAEGSRLIALVELARGGDSEAFGQLYDHYHASVYRFVYYRVGSIALSGPFMKAS